MIEKHESGIAWWEWGDKLRPVGEKSNGLYQGCEKLKKWDGRGHEREVDRQITRQTNRQSDWQTECQRGKQADRQRQN